ncbi:MAG TPA: hypothetical protein VK681_12740 [Reyranella sp.]|nr:hypothetical protein [Reyranella sp.]
MNVELDRMGYRETVIPEPMETTMAPNPKKGRPPKPRCEHNMIADRCPDCNDELAV